MKILKNVFLIIMVVTSLYSEECREVTIDKKHFFVNLKVEGPRGTLKIPALIDTGASMSTIPESIALGIGYENTEVKEFNTVNGLTKLHTIKIEKLSFLNFDFNNVNVAIDTSSTKKINKIDQFIPSYPVGYSYKSKEKEVKEIATIGMSELLKTSFSYKDGILKVCR